MHRRVFLHLLGGHSLALPLLRASAALMPQDPSRSHVAEERDEPVRIDLRSIPFSCAGSYLTINGPEEAAAAGTDRWRALSLQTVRKTAATYRYQTGAWSHDLCRIELLQGDAPADFRVLADAGEVRLKASAAELAIQFRDGETLVFRVRGGGLRLTLPRVLSTRVQASPKTLSGFDFPSGYRVEVAAQNGARLHYERLPAASAPGGEERFDLRSDTDFTGTLRMHSEQDTAAPTPQTEMPNVSLRRWMRQTPTLPADTTPELRRATRVAWYLFWNLQVSPAGGYGHTAILSSKRTLSQVWSWDNLFNALAVVDADPSLAWAQLALVLDHQRDDGALPDTVNDDRATYGFVKPPLWAWTVRRLLRSTPETMRSAKLHEVFPAMVRLHRWWLRTHDLRGDGAPAYLSGNDSGWDNATIFAEGWPVQSPDLLALLAVDALCLSELAAAMSNAAEATRWRAEGDRLIDLLHRHFVRDEELVTFVGKPGGWEECRSTSLLTRVPILLGSRLHANVRRRIVDDLRDSARFAAPSGPASESLASSLYESNGYWRGPVWGPSTLLICEGLRDSGEVALANDLARRYRRTVAREAAFRENYDARTGAGQYDTGMTWCAADYLLLGHFAP